MKEKYLHQYTPEKTNFNGWRFCICRKGRTLCKYFSAKQLGSEERAHKAARKYKERVLSALEKGKNDIAGAFEKLINEEVSA